VIGSGVRNCRPPPNTPWFHHRACLNAPGRWSVFSHQAVIAAIAEVGCRSTSSGMGARPGSAACRRGAAVWPSPKPAASKRSKAGLANGDERERSASSATTAAAQTDGRKNHHRAGSAITTRRCRSRHRSGSTPRSQSRASKLARRCSSHRRTPLHVPVSRPSFQLQAVGHRQGRLKAPAIQRRRSRQLTPAVAQSSEVLGPGAGRLSGRPSLLHQKCFEVCAGFDGSGPAIGKETQGLRRQAAQLESCATT